MKVEGSISKITLRRLSYVYFSESYDSSKIDSISVEILETLSDSVRFARRFASVDIRGNAMVKFENAVRTYREC